MHLGPQYFSLGFALLGFAVSLLPRNYTAVETGADSIRLLPWPKLIRFPIFWLGLLLLGYITLQAINPAWTYQTDGKMVWMRSVTSSGWLPVGVEVPFAQWGPWRMLMIYGTAWLTVCAIWTGFTRRRTVQVLLGTVAINGLLLALFGVVGRLFGNGRIYWYYDFPGAGPYATFVYRNHAAAYLLVTLVITCGFAGWFYLRGLRRMEKSNPSGVFAFFATCIAVSVVTSHARGATLVMLVFLFACIVAFVVHQIVMPREQRKPVIAVFLVLIFGFFLKTGFDALRSGEAWDRMKAGITRQDMSLTLREWATKATWSMFREHWLTGAGAGSFRFVFPIYQHRDPRLVASPDGKRMYWEQAHNDIAQFPAELGVIGTGLIFIGLGWWFLRLIRNCFWANALSACGVGGLLLLLAYSWFDFPLQCPAILITWCALWPTITLWTQFEEYGGGSVKR
jgi:O-antigen ligase